ncbi:hypothetical protein Poli38472_006678 [Pythium oligandrum]|uniref:RING-type E3 ubiquitin transferase n=1 Tax=Pythium oligandrum TaxID=41045 RepID=A0A8K1FFC7_PYTOL|nr:hypothetical protein Poli38472_006678 [Pythium oligandrum]|eukprot:TMW56668.1 hypothetical protein Poli38472_006678 [Pythium oligandrum]
MGHTGSVQRPRRSNSRQSQSGVLYGEPVGSAAAANAANQHANYTPAQLQALYLSRGRPDLAFMTNQTSRFQKEVPEMQQTCTVKNHVNLKKGTLKLTPLGEDQTDRYSLEFSFDATKPCRIKVYAVVVESIDEESGSSAYALVHSEHSLPSADFPEGLSQKFELSSLEDAETIEPCLDLSKYSKNDLIYEDSATQRFPLVIVLEVRDSGKKIQSQSTFATFVEKSSGEWSVKVLKQKIQVDGMTYELQEIYGIDGSVAAAPKSDAAGDPAGNKAEELEIPDGAECIICMSEPRNTTVLPCRHMCLCGECAEALRKSSSTCPICRTRVEALLQIRVDAKENNEDDD